MGEGAFFDRPAATVARAMIGWRIEVDGVGGLIVETEAYDIHDPASHSYGGPRRRNAPMFGPPGHAYVYRIYGLHWCFNIVCDASQPGSAVLIRAIEPLDGLDLMRLRRRQADDRSLCSGPGRLCEALAIDGSLTGADVTIKPFRLAPAASPPVVEGVRIGLSRGMDTPWRYGWAGSAWLSRPFPSA